MILQENNMRECFEYLLKNLRERLKDGLPNKETDYFRGMAESIKVDTNSFNCRAVSLCMDGFWMRDRWIFSLGLYALHAKVRKDMGASLERGKGLYMVNFINNHEEEIISRMMKLFYQINRDIVEEDN